MAVNEAYQLKTRDSSVTVSEGKRFSIRPGPISFIALLIAILSMVAWVRNEQIVVWMLEKNIADEGSTESLLGAVRTAATIIGSMALASSWRLFATGIVGTYNLRAVRAVTVRINKTMAPFVRLLVTPISAARARIYEATVAVLGFCRTGVMTIASLTRRVLDTVAKILSSTSRSVVAMVSVPVRAARVFLGYAGHRFAVAASVLGWAITNAFVSVRNAARAVAVAVARGFRMVTMPVIVGINLAFALAFGGMIAASIRVRSVVSYGVGLIVAVIKRIGQVLATWWEWIVTRLAVAVGFMRTLAQSFTRKIFIAAPFVLAAVGAVIARVRRTILVAIAKVVWVAQLAAHAVRKGVKAVITPLALLVTASARYVRTQINRTLARVWLVAIVVALIVRRVAGTSLKQVRHAIRFAMMSTLAVAVLGSNAVWSPIAVMIRHAVLASKAVAGSSWAAIAKAYGALTSHLEWLAVNSSQLVGKIVKITFSAVRTSTAFTGQVLTIGWLIISGTTARGWLKFTHHTSVGIRAAGTAVRVAVIALMLPVLSATNWLVQANRLVLRVIRALTTRLSGLVVTAARQNWRWTSGGFGLCEAGVTRTSRLAYRWFKVPLVYVASAVSSGVETIASAASSVISGAAQTARFVYRSIGSAARNLASPVVRAGGHALHATWLLVTVIWNIAAAVAKSAAGIIGAVLAMVASTVTAFARLVAEALQVVWSMMTNAVAYVSKSVALAGATVLAVLTAAMRSLRHWTALALGTMLIGLVALVAPVAVLGQQIAESVKSGVTAIGLAISSALIAVTSVLRLAGSTAGEGISLAGSSSALAAITVTRPIMVASAALARHFYTGAATLWLAASWALLMLRVISKRTRLAAGQAAIHFARTLSIGTGTAPDIVRFAAITVRNQKGVSAMTESNLNQSRLLSLMVTLVVFAVLVAVPVRIFWPAPPEPTVTVAHWATGHLTREGLLKEMADKFNDAGHRTQSGVKIKIEVYDAPSELQGKYVSELLRFGTRRNLHKETNGYMVENAPDPTIVTPSSAHWLVTLNHEVGREVVDLKESNSIVSPVIGIVTYTEMARCLGWPEKQIGYQDIIDLRENPLGWRAYECADPTWGEKPLLAFTDPTTSSTGRSLHMALYSIAAGKPPEALTREDITKPEVVDYLKRFQALIDHYQIGTTVLNTKIYQGPEYGHFFVMPEDNLIHLYEGTERAYLNGIKTTAPAIEPGSMVMLYPREGSMPRKNCACIVNADWVSAEQREAAGRWIEFIREDEQQRAFMASGFRPRAELDMNDPLNIAASKITTEFGLSPDTPTPVLNPSFTPSQVSADIDANWENIKRPGIVTFVVDTSGSMLGSKIELAREGLTGALTSMASNNQVGLVTFDSKVNVNLPVGPMESTKWDIAAVARELKARGETALYDAIDIAIKQTDEAEGPENAIRGVVVLTDGRANAGTQRLDRIVEMETRGETKIRAFDGYEGSVPIDIHNSRHEIEDLIGVGDAKNTEHEIQIFFIGIGDDADIQVGRLLAEATGAEFVGVAEEDLAQVLEEFSKYF